MSTRILFFFWWFINSGLWIPITLAIFLIWYLQKANRNINGKPRIYNDWWSARQKRMAWKKDHQQFSDCFRSPEYQKMWDREIWLEAHVLWSGLATKELSFDEWRAEKAMSEDTSPQGNDTGDV